jgi:hypothetical protein
VTNILALDLTEEMGYYIGKLERGKGAYVMYRYTGSGGPQQKRLPAPRPSKTRYLIIDIRDGVSMPFFLGWVKGHTVERTLWSGGDSYLFDDVNHARDELLLIQQYEGHRRDLRVQPCKDFV